MSGDLPSATQSSHELQAAIRREDAGRIAADVIRRRAAGEVIPDEVVIADHLQLMPELAEELRGVRDIHQLTLAARKAGPASAVTILSVDELETPIADGEMIPPAAPSSDLPRVEGFTILNEIGRGGQAVVFRAVQDSTGRRVAMKILSGGAEVESEHRARFEREVRALAALDHPHIVGIIDRGRTGSGAFYLAMELVEGWTFDEFAAECRTVDDQHPRMLLGAMVKVARAVHAAHEKGVIHRDLKPSNLRIDRRGEPRVLDFGLAKATETDQAITATGQWVGSLPWFSPEVANHGQRSADERSDVYALGVVFYQALTGRFPYEISGPLPEVLRRICHAAPQPAQVPGLRRSQAALNAVLLKALAKSPADRYASAAALADDLEALLQGVIPAASHAGRRRRRRGMLAGVAAVVLLANVAWWLWPAPAPQPYQLPAMQNSLGMKLLRVPRGTFTIGSPADERLSKRDETQHQVTLTRDYWMGATEVTRAQFNTVMGLPPPPSAEAQLPAVNLSREVATLFCRRLSEIDGRPYRLPTEAEWEHACRGDGTAKPLDQQAWIQPHSQGKVRPVATRLPNEWGLHDMLGNAEEWVLDGYTPYTADRVTDPLVPSDGRQGILRGGDVHATAATCRIAARHPADPQRPTGQAGLRVVLETAPPATTRSHP